MNISLQKPVNYNNNNAIHSKSSYSTNLKNVSFCSSVIKRDFFTCTNLTNFELEQQEKIMRRLAGAFFVPNGKYLFKEHSIDQKKFATLIKRITGRDFETVLNSKTTIKALLQRNFNQEDIDKGLESIFNKTFDNTVCLGLNQNRYLEKIDEIIKKIEKDNFTELNPARLNQERALNDYNRYDRKFFRNKRKLSKEIILLKNEKKRLELEDEILHAQEIKELEQQIRLKENSFIRLERKGSKKLKLKKAIFLSAKADLDKIEGKIQLAKYKKLPTKRNINKLSLILGKVYESLAAKEVNRIIIPNIAEKLAIKELEIEKAAINPALIKKKKQEIQKQLYQIKNVSFGPIEVDHMIVRVKSEPELVANRQKAFSIVEAVGVVESKYNPNDISHGFRMRIENLKWLQNRENYFKEIGYNRTFDEKYYYDSDRNINFHFNTDSFKNFCVDTNDKRAYENIYFVTTNKGLIDLDKRILNQMPDLNLKSEQSIKNEIGVNSKQLLSKYDQYELWDNVIFTNDDYCGYSLSNLLFYFKYRDAIKDAGITVFDYHKLNDLVTK